MDCSPDASPDPCFEGCTCKTGFTRLNNDPRSPCVPSDECSTTYTTLNTFNFFEIVENADIPELVDPANPRTFNRFKNTFAGTVLGNSSLYVLNYNSVNYVESDGHGWTVKDVQLVQYQFADDVQMAPIINKFLNELGGIDRSRLDFVLETDSDFGGFVDDQSFHFPCYNRLGSA